MTKKKTSMSRSSALVPARSQSLTAMRDEVLADAIGSSEALSKLEGTSGEFIGEEGVVRITGVGYATDEGTVPAAELYFVKGDKPRVQGVWLGEADKVAWIDPATGLECIMLRDRDEGFLSGFVGVPAGHPLFGWDQDALTPELGIEVHGGVTQSRICDDGPSPRRRLIIEARRICHVVVGEMPLNHATDHRPGHGQWWFGFDCDHVYDVVPGRRGDRQRFMGAETSAEYRTDGYVFREVRNLAAQLKAIADGRPVPAREGPPLPPIGLEPYRGG